MGKFHVYFKPSKDNLGDYYYTKHFVAKHHQLMQPTYLFATTRSGLAASVLQGCAETPVSGSKLGFNSFDSGSHKVTRLLSPMTAHGTLG
jgi:hypothetical protein